MIKKLLSVFFIIAFLLGLSILSQAHAQDITTIPYTLSPSESNIRVAVTPPEAKYGVNVILKINGQIVKDQSNINYIWSQTVIPPYTNQVKYVLDSFTSNCPYDVNLPCPNMHAMLYTNEAGSSKFTVDAYIDNDTKIASTSFTVEVYDPAAVKHPISWQTDFAKLTASDFVITVNGKNFYGNDTVKIHSNPASDTYTTLEAIWFENGIEMRMFIYFASDENTWKVSELRTYNGNSQGDWYYYEGFGSWPVGQEFKKDSFVLNSKDGSGKVSMTNMVLKANFALETNPPLPVEISRMPTPTIKIPPVRCFTKGESIPNNASPFCCPGLTYVPLMGESLANRGFCRVACVSNNDCQMNEECISKGSIRYCATGDESKLRNLESDLNQAKQDIETMRQELSEQQARQNRFEEILNRLMTFIRALFGKK